MDLDCVDVCQQTNVSSQPDVVRSYIKAMFYIVIPICQLLSTVHIVLFPIRGDRLKRLVRRQSQSLEYDAKRCSKNEDNAVTDVTFSDTTPGSCLAQAETLTEKVPDE